MDIEIFLDRFLPHRVLNLIYNSMIQGEVFGEKSKYKRIFLKEMNNHFQTIKEKVEKENQYDKR